MNQIRAAIYSRLSADATLTALLSTPTAIFHAVAPQTATAPLIVFHKQSGTPDWQFAGAHIQWDIWTVKAVTRDSSANRAEDIAARIDVVLTDAPLVITGRALLGVWRESDIDYVEVDGADRYEHVGSQYRLTSVPA